MGKKGVCKRLSQSCENPDLEHLIIDSTIVRAHQHAAGAKKGEVKMRRSGVRAAALARRSALPSTPSAAPARFILTAGHVAEYLPGRGPDQRFFLRRPAR
jgi:hypothetical protein